MEFWDGVNSKETHEKDSSKFPTEKDSEIKANETLISSKTNIENVGLAVFHSDKLVGELTGIETICHQIISNKLDTCTINIPNPFEEGKTISLRLRLSNKTNNNVTITENRSIYHL